MSTPSKLDKAKTQLVVRYPFWASLLLKYPLIHDESVGTLAVDAKGQIYYSETFINKWTVDQLVWALAHEVAHKIGNHVSRRGTRDPRKWNIATDAWVNDWLAISKVGTPIPNCISMPGSYGKMIEEIYAKLPDRQSSAGDSDPMQGDLRPDLCNATPSEIKDAETQMKVDVMQAHSAAKMRGMQDAGASRLIDTLLAVNTPWYDHMERFMVSKSSVESTWARPNRRFKVYLPSSKPTPTMGTLVIGIDVSGSISNTELNCFGSHTKRIIEMCNPEKVVIMYCHSHVCRTDIFEQGEEVVFHTVSSGGTDMRRIFAEIDKLACDPVAVVIFTDGETPYPATEKYPTLWAVTDKRIKAPALAGETVHFQVD